MVRILKVLEAQQAQRYKRAEVQLSNHACSKHDVDRQFRLAFSSAPGKLQRCLRLSISATLSPDWANVYYPIICLSHESVLGTTILCLNAYTTTSMKDSQHEETDSVHVGTALVPA